MAFVDPFDKLAEDLGAVFRPQREWVERRGLLLVAGHFLSGIGAGCWLFSLIFGFRPGLVTALAVMAASGLAHLMFLGRWRNFWRMVTRPQSSWISRGLLAMTLFLLGAFFYTISQYYPSVWEPSGAFGRTMLAMSLIGTAGVLVYKGFVYAVSRAIPFWDTPLLPVLYIGYALRGGVAILLLGVIAAGQGLNLGFLKMLEFWIITSTAVLVLFYLAVMRGAGVATQKSVRELVAGQAALAFYLGTVFFGLVIPLVIGAVGQVGALSGSLVALVATSSLIGDFYIKYCINKAGVYVPLLGEFPVKK